LSISGTNFVQGFTTVFVGGIEATNVVVSTPTQLTATAPARATASAVDVVLTAPGGTVIDPTTFWYYGGSPLTLNFTPTGTNRSLTVPAGTFTATVNGSAGGWGGAGASIQGSFAVAAGDELTIVVGTTLSTYAGAGAAVREGDAQYLNGGGYSAIFKANAAVNEAGKPTANTPGSILIPSGGGGGGWEGTVFPTGNAGGWGPESTPASTGGSGGLSTGGITISNSGNGTAGGPNGGSFQGGVGISVGLGGGGGGGGYYGGGGGSENTIPTGTGTGAGGSSYVSPSVTFISSALQGDVGSIVLAFVASA